MHPLQYRGMNENQAPTEKAAEAVAEFNRVPSIFSVDGVVLFISESLPPSMPITSGVAPKLTSGSS